MCTIREPDTAPTTTINHPPDVRTPDESDSLLHALRRLGGLADAGREGCTWCDVAGAGLRLWLTLVEERPNWYVDLMMAHLPSAESVRGWLRMLPLEAQRVYLRSEQAEVDVQAEVGRMRRNMKRVRLA